MIGKERAPTSQANDPKLQTAGALRAGFVNPRGVWKFDGGIGFLPVNALDPKRFCLVAQDNKNGTTKLSCKRNQILAWFLIIKEVVGGRGTGL